MSPPIVYDYTPIAERMAEIARDRDTPFTLPAGVHIVRRHVPYVLLAGFDMCFLWLTPRLRLIKSRTNNFCTSNGVNMISYLTEVFPSACRRTGTHDIELAAADAARLTALLNPTLDAV
jgi:hypothetical protein